MCVALISVQLAYKVRKAFVARKIPSDWDPPRQGKGRQEDCGDSVSVEMGIPCILRAETNDQPYCKSSSARPPQVTPGVRRTKEEEGSATEGVE